jgi:hypothetical protein
MDLAKEILGSAKPSQGNKSWFDGLSEEHQSAIREVRDHWRRTAESSGVSACQMAKTIIEKLTARGYKVSKYKQVVRWLTHS